MGAFGLNLLVFVGIYSLLAYGSNLVTGYGGLLVFCQAAFYGIGAYAVALLSVGAKDGPFSGELAFSASLPFPLALLTAAAASGAAAAVFGAVALRFRGDSFVFATIGFQMIFFTILYNWEPLGRGALGIYGIPQPNVFGWKVDGPRGFALLVLAANAATLPALFSLYRSPFGLSLRSLRDDERAAESLGISAYRQRLWALAVSGTVAGVAGGLFAAYTGFIDPTSFTLKESIFVAALLLLGGSGNIVGPILGTLVMVGLPEALRFVHLPASAAGPAREIIYGLLLVVLMFFRPKGIAGSYALK